MVYKVIGLMSGSSLDGLDIAYVHLQENKGKWTFEIVQATCYPYPPEWVALLANAPQLPALEYQLLHTAYGHYLGELVNRFIAGNNFQYQVQLIASHGHTTFHIPAKKMTAQLGDGAAIAAATGINVVCDLRAMDIALGGQGAPIVPVGEKLLLHEYGFFLNLGGIANLSAHTPSGELIAFDVCPANRVLNMLANEAGKEYDAAGTLAAEGNIREDVLQLLNKQSYYTHPYPKSLANDFGTAILYPLLKNTAYPVKDLLRTYVEHIVVQIKNAIRLISDQNNPELKTQNAELKTPGSQLLVTGGGAFNTFLVERLQEALKEWNIAMVIPAEELVKYKEAVIMALIGVLRWREENSALASVTGAARNSIGGAVWIGQEA